MDFLSSCHPNVIKTAEALLSSDRRWDPAGAVLRDSVGGSYVLLIDNRAVALSLETVARLLADSLTH